MQLSDHQLASGRYCGIAVLGCPILAPTALNKPAQGRARHERRPGLPGPKWASPVRARHTVATFVTPTSGLKAFAFPNPGRCPGLACQRPLAYPEELSPNGGLSQAVDFGENYIGMIIFHYHSS